MGEEEAKEEEEAEVDEEGSLKGKEAGGSCCHDSFSNRPRVNYKRWGGGGGGGRDSRRERELACAINLLALLFINNHHLHIRDLLVLHPIEANRQGEQEREHAR